MCEGYNFSAPLSSLVIVCLFYCSHPSECEVMFHLGFDLHFPSDWWCRASSHVPMRHCISSLKKCLFRSFARALLGYLCMIEIADQLLIKFCFCVLIPFIISAVVPLFEVLDSLFCWCCYCALDSRSWRSLPVRVLLSFYGSSPCWAHLWRHWESLRNARRWWSSSDLINMVKLLWFN